MSYDTGAVETIKHADTYSPPFCRFSGVLQAAVYKWLFIHLTGAKDTNDGCLLRNLNGVAGRSGWRWLYVWSMNSQSHIPYRKLLTKPVQIYHRWHHYHTHCTVRVLRLPWSTQNDKSLLSFQRRQWNQIHISLKFICHLWQERVLAYTRLEQDTNLEQAKSRPLSWNLVRRIFGRWRWYACSLLVIHIFFHNFTKILMTSLNIVRNFRRDGELRL